MEINVNEKGVIKAKTDAAHGLRALFEDGLKDIYWAEQALTTALPKTLKNTSSPELIKVLTNHLSETKEHVSRLEEVFKTINTKPVAKKCEAMDGLIKEAEITMEATEIGVVRDAGIILTGQKVEHYEIATYGTLHAFALTLGEDKAAKLLALTLEEEKKADAALTKIALSTINKKAVKSDDKMIK